MLSSLTNTFADCEQTKCLINHSIVQPSLNTDLAQKASLTSELRGLLPRALLLVVLFYAVRIGRPSS